MAYSSGSGNPGMMMMQQQQQQLSQGGPNYADRCVFFSKMGACRHGDGCTKIHYRPSASPTVLFPLMYPYPLAILSAPAPTSDEESRSSDLYNFTYDKKFMKHHFEHFYKSTWEKFMPFGKIAELRVVSNLGDHLLGNVYIRFEDPGVAQKLVTELYKKQLHGIILLPELCPVVNFADACCKEDLEGTCTRGATCNYLHIMKVSKKLLDELHAKQQKYWQRKQEKALAKKSKKEKESSKHGGGKKRSRSESETADAKK